jgi:MFS family permease
MDAPQIALLATLTTAIAIPISLSSGWIMDHFGRKATLVPGFSLLLLSFFFLGLTAVIPVPFGVFLAAYLGVYACTSLTGGNMQALGSDIAPANARGQFYGVSQTLGHFGGPVATTAVALLSSGLGYWSAFGFLGLTAGCAAFILATQVPDRLRQERKASRAVATSAGSNGAVPAVQDLPVAAGVAESSPPPSPVGGASRAPEEAAPRA